MAYDHKVLAIFDPGDATGFVYTVGMHPKFELFALDVPYDLVDEVCRMMNFLSQRTVLPDQTAQSGDMIYYLRQTEHREELMETHLVQMRSDAKILQLCPIGGWPEVKETAPAGMQCSCCACKPCEA